MIKRIIEFLKRLFRRPRKAADAEPVPVRIPETCTKPAHPFAEETFRKFLLMQGIRPVRGRAGVWRAEADGFGDAYRVMLRICVPGQITARNKSGHVCCRAILPDGGGILLSDHTGLRRGAVAVMVLSSDNLPGMKEIRFFMRS